MGASAFEAVEDLLSDAPPRMQTPQTAVAAPMAQHAARNAAAAAPAKPRFVGGPAAAATPAPKPLPQPAASVSDAALAPPPPAEANGAQPRAENAPAHQGRYWMLMAGSVALGIVLAFGAVSGAMYFLGNSPPPLAQAGGHGTGPEQTPRTTPVSSPGPVTPPETSPEVIPSPTTLPQTPSPMPESPTPPMPAVTPLPPTLAGETDPAGIVKPPEPPAAKPAVSNDPLANLERLIGGAEEPQATETPTPSPVVPPADSGKPALPRPPPRDVDVARRLADPLAGIETGGTPLADFLDRFSELSTIPITLDPDWLAFAPASAETSVVYRAASTSVGEALTKALEPLRLSPVVVGDQIVVGLSQPQPLVTIQVKVKELAAGEEELNELAELLKALIEPASWTGEGGGAIGVDAAAGALNVKHLKVVQAQVHLVCEKLRTARQRPHVLKIDPALFPARFARARAAAKLATPVSLNFSQPTRLTAVLGRLGEAASVRILVDWQGIAAAGWNPDADATLVADKQPLGDALDALLNPMELAWRAIDGRTLQVVTAAKLAERCEIEFYPVADLVAGDPAGEGLQSRLPTPSARRSSRAAAAAAKCASTSSANASSPRCRNPSSASWKRCSRGGAEKQARKHATANRGGTPAGCRE